MLWAYARLGHHPGAAWADSVLATLTPLLTGEGGGRCAGGLALGSDGRGS